MKKVLLSSIFALALLATVGYGVNKNRNSDGNLSDLALANVEALADGESTSGKKCYKTITQRDGVAVLYCGTCTWIPDSEPSFWSRSSICP